MSHSIDPTTQRTEFPGNYHWQDLRDQIENQGYVVDANARPWEPHSPRHVDRMAQIEDVHSSLFNLYMTQPSDMDIVIAHPETRNHYWKVFRDQIENQGYVVDANARPWEPHSPRHVDRMAQIEDVHSSLFNLYMTQPSDMDIVIAHPETRNHYWKVFRDQIENQGYVVDANARPWEPHSPRHVDRMAQIEDVRSSLFNLYMTQPSDMDIVIAHPETGTAITDFTQLGKDQIRKQKLEISDRFDVIAQREDNWDGYESKKPTQPTLDHAKHLIEEIFDTIIGMKYPWITPFISSNEDGYITAEWYEEEREVHILIRENEAEYLQVWGINIYTEMHEDFLSRGDYPKLWEWLLHGQKQQEINIHIEMHEDFPSVQII